MFNKNTEKILDGLQQPTYQMSTPKPDEKTGYFMTISEWKNYGIKYHFYEFFEKQIKTEVLELIAKDQGWEETRDYFAKKLGLPTIYNKKGVL